MAEGLHSWLARCIQQLDCTIHLKLHGVHWLCCGILCLASFIQKLVSHGHCLDKRATQEQKRKRKKEKEREIETEREREGGELRN